MRIYVGYDLPSIICYLEPLTEDLFTSRFANYHFDKIVSPSLGGDKITNVSVERRELLWITPTMSHLDPRTPQSKTKVLHNLDLQSIAQSMLDAFIDLAKVARSHIPTANAPARMNVPIVHRKIHVIDIYCNNCKTGM
ncbi:hypothetical protein COP2_033797 [Malus domestica]